MRESDLPRASWPVLCQLLMAQGCDIPTGGAVLSCPDLPMLGHCHHPLSPDPGVTAEAELSKAVKKQGEEVFWRWKRFPCHPSRSLEMTHPPLYPLSHSSFMHCSSFPFLSLSVEVIQKVLLSRETEPFFAWSLVYSALVLCIASGTARVTAKQGSKSDTLGGISIPSQGLSRY